jgi:dipeptidyl aminopeptidase/acylaminoacyl peptidase
MSLIETITPTEAAKLLGLDIRTFNNVAKNLGFTKYPGTTPRKVRYNAKDITAKYLTPKDENPKPKKKRGQIMA